MKRVISLIGSFLFVAVMFANMVVAQPKFDPKERAQKSTKAMIEKLSLNKEQGEKIGEINLKYAEKMQEIFKKGKGNRDQMRSSMQTMRKDQEAEIKKVLTEEQYKKYQAWQKERRQQQGQRGQGRGQGQGRR
ncbi:DUF4890 domain-containing protein [Puteibacter caeruleilacunae]|nr:DUF4890 domain-containing protein [Puteibacter caeruleilacunae]